jgi:hypothetical protein
VSAAVDGAISISGCVVTAGVPEHAANTSVEAMTWFLRLTSAPLVDSKGVNRWSTVLFRGLLGRCPLFADVQADTIVFQLGFVVDL